MHTPLREGDRVHNAALGAGTVTGFGYEEGCGEHAIVQFDGDADIVSIYRFRLRRIIGTTEGGSLILGP